MVDDATVSLEGRGARLGHPDGGFGGSPQLFMLSAVRVVSVPGSAAEAAVVHKEQAGAQEEHEEHRYPMALIQRHKAHADKLAPLHLVTNESQLFFLHGHHPHPQLVCR